MFMIHCTVYLLSLGVDYKQLVYQYICFTCTLHYDTDIKYQKHTT